MQPQSGKIIEIIRDILEVVSVTVIALQRTPRTHAKTTYHMINKLLNCPRKRVLSLIVFTEQTSTAFYKQVLCRLLQQYIHQIYIRSSFPCLQKLVLSKDYYWCLSESTYWGILSWEKKKALECQGWSLLFFLNTSLCKREHRNFLSILLLNRAWIWKNKPVCNKIQTH